MAEQKKPLSQRVTLRLPDDTATEWRQRADAADQSLSDWLRSSVDGAAARQTGQRRQRRRLRTLTADPQLLRQVAAIGNNLNQLARQANQSGLPDRDMATLLAMLSTMQDSLHRLAEVPRYDPGDEGAE